MAIAKPADPWSTGIMAGASVAGKALDDQTNQTLNNSFSAGFDNSGWNVNVGAGATQSATTDRSSGLLASLGPMLQNPLVLMALAVGAYLYLKR